MENTYTYTARHAEKPERVVTFTLHGNRMSVGLSAPLQQLENVLQSEPEAAETDAQASQLWLKPLAVSLMERGVGPFRIVDVHAQEQDGWLKVKGWYRAGGLALAPITLMDGPVDNPTAANAFVKQLEQRKAEFGKPLALLNALDYWVTWAAAAMMLISLFQFWRRKNAD